VAEVDDEKDKVDPGQSHKSLKGVEKISLSQNAIENVMRTLYMPPQVEFSRTKPAGQVWYFSLYRAAVKNTAMAVTKG
jgi:hypothetical protein